MTLVKRYKCIKAAIKAYIKDKMEKIKYRVSFIVLIARLVIRSNQLNSFGSLCRE